MYVIEHLAPSILIDEVFHWNYTDSPYWLSTDCILFYGKGYSLDITCMLLSI